MKVLSITEPFATLILSGRKRIETRSWKTSYRGELYIHASSTRIDKATRARTEMMKLTEGSTFRFGQIILRCTLRDCVFMTDEFIREIRENEPTEYICGEFSPRRYAWILENIFPLPEPIPAKGRLGIWEYTENQI